MDNLAQSQLESERRRRVRDGSLTHWSQPKTLGQEDFCPNKIWVFRMKSMDRTREYGPRYLSNAGPIFTPQQ